MIREMRISDLEEVCRIEKDVFQTPWPRHFFEEEMTKNEFARLFVDETEGEIVSYGCLWFLFENCDITNIAVSRDHWKKGYGQKMLDHLIDVAIRNECEFVHLEVRVSNLPALDLYKKNGFEIVRTRKGYYEDHEDAYDMVKGVLGLNEKSSGN